MAVWPVFGGHSTVRSFGPLAYWRDIAPDIGARIVADGALRLRLTRVPMATTLIINTTGSLIFGLMTGLFTHHLDARWQEIAAMGFSGG
ncbi:hypothetical protein [Actinomadura litoris]|uniref:hypothetical protein n=1 Tax=Actinomadura litoris TaxID=2678616 RepID=UPI001FA6F04C|nr:hypothetical protein [Actinomadura litoris]